MRSIIAFAFLVATTAQAQLVTIVANTNAGRSYLEIETWQSAELMSFSPLFRNGGSMIIEKSGQNVYHSLDEGVLRPLFIVGPAKVSIAPGNDYSTMATFRLNPEPYPPTQAMLVPPGTGGATVTLECSTNLVNWSAATNGVYTNLPVAKFFRVKLDKIP